MQIYSVHLKENMPVTDFVLVKEGFCWPSLFFSVFWALGCGLWAVALALFIVSSLVGIMVSIFEFSVLNQGVISLGLGLAVGFVANDLRRWTLERRGYVLAGIVSGLDLEGAERRFLDTEFRVATVQ